MKTILKLAAALSLGALAAPQAFACFTVYNQANQIVYNAQTPPVNMSYQIHEVLPNVYPGGHLVFGNDPDCPATSRVYVTSQVVNVASGRQRGGGLRPKPDRN